MASLKRPLSAENNNECPSKRLALDSCATLEQMDELDVSFLPDSEEDPDTSVPPVFYNDHDARVAKEFKEQKKMKPVPVRSLTYKKLSDEYVSGENLFNSLPDEVLMGVLRFLKQESLVALSKTCRRFNRLCHDKSLWQRLNITSKKLMTDNIALILTLGVKVLRLNSIVFPDPLFSRPVASRLETFICEVRYLDLSYCMIKVQDLALLMSKMRHLVKLSLESATLDKRVIFQLVKNQNLNTLNLAMVVGLDLKCISLICTYLTKLESLNLGWTKLTKRAFSELCNTITPAIRHLDLSGSCLALANEGLVSLVTRCLSLETLDLSDCISMSVPSFRILIDNLTELETLAISRCYQLDKNVVLELKKLPKLKVLAAYRIITETNIEECRLQLPDVRINESPFSVVARPTVGVRRTSIWGKATVG